MCKVVVAGTRITNIGNSLAGVLSFRSNCSSLPVADADPDLPGIQPECRGTVKVPCDTPGQGECKVNGYVEAPLAQCRDGNGHPLDLENPQTDMVPANV
jgi:hypothetical protein